MCLRRYWPKAIIRLQLTHFPMRQHRGLQPRGRHFSADVRKPPDPRTGKIR
jgi:hypothetical protein